MSGIPHSSDPWVTLARSGSDASIRRVRDGADHRPTPTRRSTMGSARAEAIVTELGNPPFPVDPYPLYHELRAVAPVFFSDTEMCYVTPYAGCTTVSRAAAFGQGEGAKRVRLD